MQMSNMWGGCKRFWKQALHMLLAIASQLFTIMLVLMMHKLLVCDKRLFRLSETTKFKLSNAYFGCPRQPK